MKAMRRTTTAIASRMVRDMRTAKRSSVSLREPEETLLLPSGHEKPPSLLCTQLPPNKHPLCKQLFKYSVVENVGVDSSLHVFLT